MAAPSAHGLVTDLYQLTMLQAYLEHGMHAPATFELLFRGARRPTNNEIAANPRARSARMRAAVRTYAPGSRLEVSA